MRHHASSIVLGALAIAGCAPSDSSDSSASENLAEAASAAEVITAHPTRANAIRFLEQATFGPTTTRVDQVVASTIPNVITQEINATPLSRYSYTYYTTPVTTKPPRATCNASLPIDQADAECSCPVGALPTDKCWANDRSSFVCNAGTCQVGCRASTTIGNMCATTQVCQTPTGTGIGACVEHRMQDLGAQFFANAMSGKDQLRQRVAFALSQIWVVSQGATPFSTTTTTTNNATGTWAPGVAVYLNKLSDNAFGNYRSLMKDMTVNAAMGTYLNMANNLGYKVVNGVTTELMPNENYARELLQLFTLGVNRLNEDGTLYLVTDPVTNKQAPVPAYSQDDVENISYALTGWTYDNAAHTCPGKGATRGNSDWTLPLLPCDANHNPTPQPLLLNPVTGDRSASPGTSAVDDLDAVLDSIFEHPNLPPFVCKQLIQHLVTSNPSPTYVQSVVNVFKNDGTGVRGNLAAVVRKILEHDEARSAVPSYPSSLTFGHLRSPALMITNVLRWLNYKVDDPRSIVAGIDPNQALSATTIAAINVANGVNNQANAMGQFVPRPATVFSYYAPGEPLPGNPSLVGPEFGIQDTGTVMARSNFLNNIILGDDVSRGALGVRVDASGSSVIPNDDPSLLTWLEQNMLHGTMSNNLKSIISAAISDGNVAEAEQKPLGIYLVAMSPEYQVQR